MRAEILSVSELTQQIKTRLETFFPEVKIKGEISNLQTARFRAHLSDAER